MSPVNDNGKVLLSLVVPVRKMGVHMMCACVPTRVNGSNNSNVLRLNRKSE